MLAVVGGIAPAMAGMIIEVTAYEKFLDVVNAQIQATVDAMETPITDLGLILGTTRDGADPITATDSGKTLVFIADGSKIDPASSGTTYQEDLALIEAGTYLGGLGFYLGHTQAVTANEVAAVMTDCSLTFSRADLLGAGVTAEQVDWLFDAGNVEEDVRDGFFAEFTYFKAFEGASPAIAPVDIVAFLMDPAQGLVDVPDFVYFNRTLDANPNNDVIQVGIRYFLLDDAPSDPATPLILLKDLSWSLWLDAGTQISMNGGLLIYDGNRNGEFRDPIMLAGGVGALSDTTVGGAFPVTAENVNLLEFTSKDKFFAYYYDPVKDPDEEKLKKAAVKLAQKVDWDEDNGIVNLLWNKKIALYNAKGFKDWMKGGGTAWEFLDVAGNQVPLAMRLETVNKANNPATRILGLLTLRPPTINGHKYGDGVITLDGEWFGTKKPKVWLEYIVDGVTKARKLKVLKPADVDFLDVKGNPSYMNAADGASQVVLEFDGVFPDGYTDYFVLDNGVGLAIYAEK